MGRDVQGQGEAEETEVWRWQIGSLFCWSPAQQGFDGWVTHHRGIDGTPDLSLGLAILSHLHSLLLSKDLKGVLILSRWSSPLWYFSELSEETTLSYLGQKVPKELSVQMEFGILWQLQGGEERTLGDF